MASLNVLLADGPLDVDAARARHRNGAPGFYVAEDEDEAMFFALRRSTAGRPVGVIAVTVDDDALATLFDTGAELRPIAAGRTTRFEGRELFVPEHAFPTFNRLRMEGRIHVAVA